MDANQKLLVQRVNFRVVLFLIPAIILGTIFLFWSQFSESWGHPIRSVVLREIGVTLFVTVALTLIWDIVGKRAFTDEVLAKAGMTRDLADAGIEIVTDDFKDLRISWADLFKNAHSLDLFVSYASTWRNQHIASIDKLQSRRDSRIRVILPNPDDEGLLKSLSDRFQTTPEELKEKIQGSIAFWKQRRERGTVEIYTTGVTPFFTIYITDSKAVFALYNHRKGRIPVPTFVCDEEGFLTSYLRGEFEGILGEGTKLE